MKISLSYPEPPCKRLDTLYRGDCYILNRDFRTEHADVYMVVDGLNDTCVKVVCLNTGVAHSHGCSTKVIPMVVEIKARPMTKADEERLPF